MSFHFCYFAHFCSFLCILTNPAPEIPLLLFINIRQFTCFETMGRFSVSPCEKECALAHSRAEARLLQQPSTLAPSAHPRGAFLSYGNEVSYMMKTPVHNRLCTGLFLTYRCALQRGTPGLPMDLRAVLSISECRIRCADAGFRYCRRSPSHASHLHLSRSSCLPERGLRSR